MLRILVVDDAEIVRRGVISLLQAEPYWEVAGEAADGREAVAKARELNCDVVLLDISLPELNGLAAAALIHRLAPRSEILFLSQHLSRGIIEEALKVGGRGYLSKSDAGNELLDGIRAVSNHRNFISSSCRHIVSLPPGSQPISTQTQ